MLQLYFAFQFSAFGGWATWASLYCLCHCWLCFIRVSPLSCAFFPLLAASRAPIKQTQIIERLILILIIFLVFSIMSLLKTYVIFHALIILPNFLYLSLTKHSQEHLLQTWIFLSKQGNTSPHHLPCEHLLCKIQTQLIKFLKIYTFSII